MKIFGTQKLVDTCVPDSISIDFSKQSISTSIIMGMVEGSLVGCFLSDLIGQAKRAPHWGVQSRFRVIYMYV